MQHPGRLAVMALLCVTGCDPLMSVRGKVQSVPRGSPLAAAEPLPGAQVIQTCQGNRHVLTTTNADGNFEYTNIGFWDRNCELEVSAPDARHEKGRIAVGSLCQQANKLSCGNVPLEWNITLDRKDANEVGRKVQVTLDADAPDIHFYTARGHTMDELCLAPCTTKLLVGEHALGIGPTKDRAVRVLPVNIREDSAVTGTFHENRNMRSIGRILALAGGVGWISTSIFGLATGKNSVILWGGLASVPFVGIGVGLSDAGQARGTVHVTPAAGLSSPQQ
jgi:hypothetical protein